ncbi:MAG: S1 RNA-binding domain-containing protein [Acidobacteria bacterium]|nr:S1 RNA-binding domain-containing protein [Acidobacteriota bacterium]
MSVSNTPEPVQDEMVSAPETSTFGDILSQFEQEHKADPNEALQGTVVAVTAENIVVDIGRKLEGILALAPFQDAKGNVRVKVGDAVPVMITGRGEGYFELSTLRVKRPTDWTEFEKAFAEKAIVAGTVTEVVKGGLRVEVSGVRAFMPASRSGAKDPAEMEKLIGQEIRCRITKLDVADEDLVVDRRGVLEEENAKQKEAAFQNLKEGTVVHGSVRTITEFGAFVDLGGVDGLLHVGDMSWNRVKAADIVSVGDSVEVKILRIDPNTRKISLGMKQLQPDPWTVATQSLKVNDRVKGKVVRLADFGAFVEILPGVDGLVHLSSMAWGKRVKKPSDIVKVGDVVDAVILDIKPADKRISLSLKEALGDPWDEAEKRFPVGTILESVPVVNLAKFGAFVDLGEGLEGMVHIADITSEKRLEHPKDVLSSGQNVRVLVLEVDKDKRRIRLGMKQLEPTVMDTFLTEHKIGDTVNGRVVSVDAQKAKVELAEGVTAICPIPKDEPAAAAAAAEASDRPKVAVTDLGAMLAQRWKSGPAEVAATAPKLRPGEVRPFVIKSFDMARKTVEVTLA